MKNKISIRKEIRIGAGLVILLLLIAFSERQQSEAVCKNVLVELVNVNDNHFLDEKDISRQVDAIGKSLKGASMERINLKGIEKALMFDRHIQDAELYTDLKGNLIVRVELRSMMARIVQDDAPDAYIAEDGAIMDTSEKFSSRVMIVSGRYVKKLLQSGNLTRTPEGKTLLEMIEFINEDPFWRAQVAQLDMNSQGEITIYPQVTGQVVEFGKAEDFERKFLKLMVFYKEILPQKGWTKYERVNLTYDGQVIAQ